MTRLLTICALASAALSAQVVSYSSYLGGAAGDSASAIAVDSAGNTYIAGRTESLDLAAVGAGAPQRANRAGPFDVFVAKIDAAGKTVTFLTFFGGSGYDNASAIAVDAAGNIYIAGATNSTDFPVSNAAFQRAKGFGFDGFVVKLSPAGAVIYSTLLGGNGDDFLAALAVDSTGAAYVAGSTLSGDLLSFPNAYQRTRKNFTDMVVAKFTPAGNTIAYLTYVGAGGDEIATGIAIDGAGNAYVTGYVYTADFPTTAGVVKPAGGANNFYDGVVLKLDAAGSALLFSTYLGGADNDRAMAIALDGSGNVYVTGDTQSGDFPVRTPMQTRPTGNTRDAFVTKLNSTATAIVYSTYLGGTSLDGAGAIRVDASGNAIVLGDTLSADFPVTANAYKRTHTGADRDPFLVRLKTDGTGLEYGTYLGGTAEDNGMALALDAAGNAYLAGLTWSADLPVSADTVQAALRGTNDSFALKLDFTRAPLVTSAGLEAVRPGQFFSIAASGVAELLFDGERAPWSIADGERILGIAPYGLLGKRLVRVSLPDGDAVVVPVR